MTPWGEFLNQLLTERGLKAADFAALVKADPSFVSKVMHGRPQANADSRYKPPLEKLEAWADALNLNPADRDRFVELGQLMHAPDEIVARFLTLRARLVRNEERIRALEDERKR